MRKITNNQMILGEVDISQIQFNAKSRDETPQLLKGLQFIYTNPDIKKEVFKLLELTIPCLKNGRPGMDLWRILVLGTIRLNNNIDYDKLHDLANNHSKIREMLGISPWTEKPIFSLQTIKDNIKLLMPETLDKINVIVVNAGHKLLKKKKK